MEKKIKTLDDLADYINASEEYPNDVEDIAIANDWVVGFNNDDDICYNTNIPNAVEVLRFNEEGKAETAYLTEPIRASWYIQDTQRFLILLRQLNILIVAKSKGYKGNDVIDAYDYIEEHCEPIIGKCNGYIKGSYNLGDTLSYVDDNGWRWDCTGQFERDKDGTIFARVINSNGDYVKVISD